MKQISKQELKEGGIEALKAHCERLREEIFRTVSVCGGHLSSNLGAVELTVALHRVFDFPRDKIVFDVGHQCYTHKLLSERAEQFSTLRKRGGLSGFPKRTESEYDCYDTGHAGTAVSAALGLAKARDLRGETFEVIALVGDGAFQNGLVYEALNSLKLLNTRILILLNDNGMSISPTLGGAHEILEELRGEGDDRADDVRLFERFGLEYKGVVNGNDLCELLPALEEAKQSLSTRSVLLHVTTKKGQGYAFCENAPAETHGILPETPHRATYAEALGEELVSLAGRDERIVAVTAAMTDSLGLRPFFEQFPARAFDVGICEEHASVLSAALAAGGFKPYFAIYSTFLQRAYDEVIHDICGQKLPVVFCIDRAGISGADGETHQGVFDLSYLQCIPDLTIAIPKDIGEFRAMLRLSADYPSPLAIRYPREGHDSAPNAVEMGKFEILHRSMSDIIILAAGERCISLAQDTLLSVRAEGMDATLINARFLKPLDEELLRARSERFVITIEDNVLIGGLGDAVMRFYEGSGKRVIRLGYRDAFVPHGTPRELAAEAGVSKARLVEALRECYARG